MSTRQCHRQTRGIRAWRNSLLAVILLAMPPLSAVHETYARTTEELNARSELVRILGAMRDITALRSSFLCEKKLQVLRKPFFSRGVITIARPRQVRFQTNWPYRSCYILNGRTIYMRNEVDSHWHDGTVNSQPALGIILRQFAAWSLGDAAQASARYQITVQTAARPAPVVDAPGDKKKNVGQNVSPFMKLRLFTLCPNSGVLKEAIKEIQLGFDIAQLRDAARTGGSQQVELRFIRIVSTSGDQSLFWLRHNALNPRLKPTVFAPVGPA